MKQLLLNSLGKIHNKIKSSEYFSKLYYSVANRNYFNSFLEQEKMLADKGRMNAYHKAITSHVNKDDIVIDLGTGTGILSFFASQKSPKKIYAIEHGAIIESAKKIAVHNNITSIDFVNVNSKNFTAVDKADILIHEQIGALLFDENMNENILDLRDRMLKQNGKILPAKFEVYLVPVKLKSNYTVPYIWEQNIHGIKYDCFDEMKSDISAGYGILYTRPENIDCFLSEPEKILFFDLEKMNDKDIQRHFSINSVIIKDGECSGLCFFFDIIFDDENKLSTNPLTSSTHWNIPILRTESKYFKTGDEISYSFEWKDPADLSTYKWKFNN